MKDTDRIKALNGNNQRITTQMAIKEYNTIKHNLAWSNLPPTGAS